jgi:hypothetical protein
MQRMNPEQLAPDHSVAADIFLREVPDEEQEDEKNDWPGTIPYEVSLRRRLFNELVSARHRSDSGVDPAVVRMGFTLLLDGS